jgi:hypothetical protein
MFLGSLVFPQSTAEFVILEFLAIGEEAQSWKPSDFLGHLKGFLLVLVA